MSDRAVRSVPAVFHRVFHRAPVGLEIVDLGGTIVEVNPAYAAMFGRSPEDLVGETIAALTHPDDLEVSGSLFEDLVAGRIDSVRVTKRCVRHDGSVFPVHVTASLIPAEPDAAPLVVGLVEDLTQRRRDEERREQHVRELREANERLEAFTATVAHDLAQPIQGVAGLLATVKRLDADLPDDVRTLVDRAEDAAQRLGEIVTALLHLVRDDAPVETTLVDLDRCFARVCDALAVQIERAGATIAMPNLPIVTGDPMALEIVLQNLVVNALVHAGPRPTIRAGGRPTIDGWVVWVEDDGPGIPEPDRERVLSPLQRGTSSSPGHGLGLATCQRLVDKHGGRIRIEAAAGGGTRVVFTIPRAAD